MVNTVLINLAKYKNKNGIVSLTANKNTFLSSGIARVSAALGNSA